MHGCCLNPCRKSEIMKGNRMCSDQKQLCDKMQEEYALFIKDLKQLPKDKILECAYEKTIKEDILYFTTEHEVQDEMAKALRQLRHPLEAVYQTWQAGEDTYMDRVQEAFEECAGAEIKKQSRKRINKER